MKITFFLFYSLFSISIFCQSTGSINVIYESNDEIVMNTGKKYLIIKDTPYYAVADTTIRLQQKINGQIFRLNRVLELENGEEKKQLIELIKQNKLVYKYREKESIHPEKEKAKRKRRKKIK